MSDLCPVIRTVLARKIIQGDEASCNEGLMMWKEMETMLSIIEGRPTTRAADGYTREGFFEHVNNLIKEVYLGGK